MRLDTVSSSSATVDDWTGGPTADSRTATLSALTTLGIFGVAFGALVSSGRPLRMGPALSRQRRG